MAPLSRVASGRMPEGPFLYAILDASMLADRTLTQWVDLVAGEGRATVVQWRFKGLDDAAALEGARELRAATRKAGVAFFVNDRPDIARVVGADGIHVGQEDLDPGDVRALLPDALIGVSTHTPAQFDDAIVKPVDYIAVGPVFGTASKANPDPVVGVEFVSWARRRSQRPIVAIGGITLARAPVVAEAGADGLAVISELMKAADPEAAARAFVSAIRV